MKFDWRMPIFLTAVLFGLFGSTGFGDANDPFDTIDVVTSAPNGLGVPPVMELDTDNLPVFLYFRDAPGMSPTTGSLRLYRCDDLDCSTGTDTEIVASLSRSIAIGLVLDANNFPAIAYWVSSTSIVHVIRCSSVACTGAKTDHTITGAWGSSPSVLDFELAGNLPAMVLNVSPDRSFVRCLLPDCSTGTEAYTLPSIGSLPQLEFTSGGLPVISLQSFVINEGLEIIFCDDPVCLGPTEPSAIIETDTSLGYHASLILDELDRPRIAYGNNLNSLLKLAICADSACGGSTIIRTLNSGTLVHVGNSIALRNGLPVVAYSLNTSGMLGTRVVHCEEPTCGSYNMVEAEGPHSSLGNTRPSLHYRPDDGYFLGFYSRSDLDMELLRAEYWEFDPDLGDVDCTGEWTAQDVFIIMRMVAGLPGEPTPVEPCNAEADGVTGINLGDVVFAKRRAAGLE